MQTFLANHIDDLREKQFQYIIYQKWDTPPKYVSSGNLAQSLSEVGKEHRPPGTSFSVWGGLFPPPNESENVLVLSILSSLKSLKDHLLQLKEFAQIVGNLSIVFQLATTKKDAIEEMLQVERICLDNG